MSLLDLAKDDITNLDSVVKNPLLSFGNQL